MTAVVIARRWPSSFTDYLRVYPHEYVDHGRPKLEWVGLASAGATMMRPEDAAAWVLALRDLPDNHRVYAFATRNMTYTIEPAPMPDTIRQQKKWRNPPPCPIGNL